MSVLDQVLACAAEWQREYTYDAGVPDPWWADNLGHVLAGAGIGALAHTFLGTGYVGTGLVFLALAGAWEWYEYAYDVRPWDPREGWSVDRAMEDTILDTYAGLTGALLAVFLL